MLPRANERTSVWGIRVGQDVGLSYNECVRKEHRLIVKERMSNKILMLDMIVIAINGG